MTPKEILDLCEDGLKISICCVNCKMGQKLDVPSERSIYYNRVKEFNRTKRICIADSECAVKQAYKERVCDKFEYNNKLSKSETTLTGL